MNYCYNTQITVFSKKVQQNKTKHEKQRTTFQEDYIFTQKKDVKTLLNNKFSTTSFYLLQADREHKTYNGTDGYFSRDSKSLLLNLKTTKSVYHNNRLWPLSWHDLFVPSVRFGNSHQTPQVLVIFLPFNCLRVSDASCGRPRPGYGNWAFLRLDPW